VAASTGVVLTTGIKLGVTLAKGVALTIALQGDVLCHRRIADHDADFPANIDCNGWFVRY
jgi:hypothetical protein